MESTDPSIVSTFEERTQKLKERVQQKLQHFEAQRTAEYKNIVCSYSETKTCTNGTHRLKTCDAQLTVPPIMAIIESSIRKTESGDLKKFSRSGNTFYFAAGRSSPGRATAFVSVQARYSDAYVEEQIAREIATLKAALNNLAIPTEG
jgi:hypothetical protein